ncbi:MAG: 3-isopropylmalate dehydratase small subunit [bacterium]
MPTRQIGGFSHKFGDHINTDYIISGRYKFSTLDMNELAKHIMEDLDNHFYEKIKPGDMIVAGENFGCGSSREQATLAIKHAQISAVLAKSFARIFYRNAINGGLVVIECDTDKIEDGDQLAIDLEKGMINNLTKNIEVKSQPLPLAMIKILSEGGLVAYFKKYKTFEVK